MRNSANAIISFMTRTAYRKEIFFILMLKLVMLLVLWSFFFSHPVDHELTRMQLVQHFMMVNSERERSER